MKPNKRIRAKTRDAAITFRMPAGIPGSLSRSAEQSTVDTVNLEPNSFPAYGLGGLIDANTGNFRLVTAGDTAISGILVRDFPTGASQDGLGTSTPPAKGLGNRLLRGFMSVLLGGATAAKKDGAVLKEKFVFPKGQFWADEKDVKPVECAFAKSDLPEDWRMSVKFTVAPRDSFGNCGKWLAVGG